MALRTHNPPPARLKKRLWWSRWSDVSNCRKAIQTHLLRPGHRKKRHGRSRFSDVLSKRMALRTHNMPSERLKKRIWCSRRRDVSRCQRPCELISASLASKITTWNKLFEWSFK
jgi:hypothetical protein